MFRHEIREIQGHTAAGSYSNGSATNTLRTQLPEVEPQTNAVGQLAHYGSSGEAERYYRLAARQGLALAQFQLGVMIECGEIAADADWVDPLANAVMYYLFAASQGLGLALYNLASCYSNGVGVEQSLGMARTYLAQAGAHGQGDAEREIALLDAPGRIAADEVERRGTGLDSTCAVPVDSD